MTSRKRKLESVWPVMPAARRRQLRDRFITVPFLNHLGMKLTRLTAGEVRIAMPVREALRQYQGLLHGGAIASLADTAATFAIAAVLSDNTDIVTVEFKLNYLAPIRSGRAVAIARPVRVGRRICSAEVHIVSSPSRSPAATGWFTMATVPVGFPAAEPKASNGVR